MKKRFKSNMALSIVSALAITAGALSMGAMAGHHGGMKGMGMHGGGEKMIERMVRHLDLTEEQEKKVWAIYDESRPELREQREAVRKLHEAISDAAESGDSREVQKLSAQLGDEVGEMVALKTEMRMKIHDALTEEQLAEAKEMREKMRKRYKERRHHKSEK